MVGESELERLRARLIHDFGCALEAYSEMVVRDDYADAAEWSERLAERWREVAERDKLEQLGAGLLPEEAFQLYQALSASLVLARSADPARRALALDRQELGTRMMLAGREGVWSDWDEFMRRVAVDRQRQQGGELQQLDVVPAKRPAARLPMPGRRKRLARAAELATMLDVAILDTRDFYYEVMGDPLDQPVRAAVLERLEAAAACEREIDRDRYVWPQPDWEATLPVLNELRSMRHSFVLALSESEERRALVAPPGERQARLFVAAELSNGASRQEAYDRFLAATRE